MSIFCPLLQAQEGDDKLGRQLRGADGTTAHLMESARAQVGLTTAATVQLLSFVLLARWL